MRDEANFQASLARVDWDLPGMEAFGDRERDMFKRLILGGDLVDELASIGWSLWPTRNTGFYDERLLRQIADFIEIQNKPFWDAYERAMCRADDSPVLPAGDDLFVTLTPEKTDE